MAKEPNTNPDSSEGRKPSHEGPSTSERSTSRSTLKTATRSTQSASADPMSSQSSRVSRPRKSASGTPLEEIYCGFSADLQQLQVEAAMKHQHLLDNMAADVEKLKNDIASLDPTKSFVRDLTEAVEKRDAAAVAEAYATLFRHTVRGQAAAEKRLLDIVTGYYRGLSDITVHAQKSFLSGARDYSDSVFEVLAESKLSELKPTDQRLAAHALLMRGLSQVSGVDGSCGLNETASR